MLTANREIPKRALPAKPMALTEFLKLVGSKKAVVWIEHKCDKKSETEPKVFAHVKNVKGFGAMAAFTDGDTMWLDTYGKLWRAWYLTEPTEEEREGAQEWGA